MALTGIFFFPVKICFYKLKGTNPRPKPKYTKVLSKMPTNKPGYYKKGRNLNKKPAQRSKHRTRTACPRRASRRQAFTRVII